MAKPSQGGAAFDIVRADTLANVPHGFFGSSDGQYDFGFNGPVDVHHVVGLRTDAANAVSPRAQLVAPRQVHGGKVVIVDRPWPDGRKARPDGDALVTSRRGVALAVVTADCAPVLFADAEAGVIGAAHAGWRGAVSGVVANTIDAMVALGARRSRITTAIGPAIAQENYEVDAAMRDHFDAEDERYFEPTGTRDGKERWLFDLPGYVANRCALSNVADIETIGHDTYSRTRQYHSYRRSVHSGIEGYSNQISIIALAA